MNSLHPDYQRIVELHRTGAHIEAENDLRGWLDQHPDHADGHYRLAALLFQKGHAPAARDALDRAIELAPAQPVYIYLRGTVRHELGQIAGAIDDFQNAIELRPGFYQAQNNLGLALQDSGDRDGAIAAFQSALQSNPDYAVAANNLGTSYLSMGELAQAESAVRFAIARQPDYGQAWDNLAAILAQGGRSAEVVDVSRRVLALRPDHAGGWFRLASALASLKRTDEAITILEKTLSLDPGHLMARLDLARLLASRNQTDQAIAQYREALAHHPGSLGAALGAALTLPVVNESVADIAAARLRFSEGLESLHSGMANFAGQPRNTLLSDLHWGNFFLAYEGGDDRALQVRYGEFVAKMLRHCLPEHMQAIPFDHDHPRRIRVGFASSFFRKCTVGMYFKAWINGLNRARFETFVYQMHPVYDQVSEEIDHGCDHFSHLNRTVTPPVEAIAEKIKSDRLDILIYPEVGMSHQTCLLAALRLAPIQCAGWGHPVTTGHANIDHFLSCGTMEPDLCRQQYSETLQVLPGIGTRYARPKPHTEGKRSDFGLPERKTLYLFPQSLFKIHPDNDTLLADILLSDPDCVLVFFEGAHPAHTLAFQNRLSKACTTRGVDNSVRQIVLPQMSHDDYLRVNCLCDVMLDCLHWSGGNTSLDALACGLPIVTLPGAFMRGRQSAGMLTLLGLNELIADNPEGYLRIARRLGTNPSWNAEIRQRIEANANRLFDDTEAIVALASILESLYDQGTTN